MKVKYKTVMVYAYTAFNLGDDLFIKVLCERYPDTKFLLYAPKDYKINFKNMKNLKIIAFDSFAIRAINYIFRKLKLNLSFRDLIAKRSDLGVYIGGSIFMQLGNWKSAFENVNKMKIKNKPFFIIGANFGPFKDKDFYLMYKKLFKKTTFISFRDKYSYNLFKDLSNVGLTDDVIFQLDIGETNLNSQEDNVVISVIKPSKKHLNNYDNVYFHKIRDITVHFIENGYKITLMSFCEKEGDKEAIEAITEFIPKKYLHLVSAHYYKHNIEETLNIIANSVFIVGTRFHSMILGWLYNKPVYPIAYSEKMTNVMKDVNFKGFYTDIKNIHKLDPKQVFKSMQTNHIDVSQQIKNSQKHFKVLDKYLLE